MLVVVYYLVQSLDLATSRGVRVHIVNDNIFEANAIKVVTLLPILFCYLA